MLEREIDWTGLDRERRFDVIENVLAGKDRANWLDGVGTGAGRDAAEAAAWEAAAGRGNGSPDGEPYVRREWLAQAQDTAEAIRRGGGFLKCEDGLVVGERRFDAGLHGKEAERVEGWRDLDEHEKLSAPMTSDATDFLGREGAPSSGARSISTGSRRRSSGTGSAR